MIVTTTDRIEGRSVTAYFGIVAGEAIIGTTIFKDLSAGITDIVGGGSAAHEEELARAEEIAMAEMVERARGADPVVDLDCEAIGGADKNMGMVVVNGTAVKLR